MPDGRLTVTLFEVETYTFISMERLVSIIGLGCITRCTEIRCWVWTVIAAALTACIEFDTSIGFKMVPSVKPLRYLISERGSSNWEICLSTSNRGEDSLEVSTLY